MAELDNEWVESTSDYQAFLLRCWREAESDGYGMRGCLHNWHFSIARSPAQKDSAAFSCLEDLASWLAEELQMAAGRD